MSNRQPISTFLGIAAAVVLVGNSYAAIINVPGDQPTIQEGINLAANGDEVVVAQGTYFENINFNGKAITVRSTDPNDPVVVMHTIINGGGSGSVVTCTSGEGSNTVLSGFVITGGTGTDIGGGFTSGGGMYNVNSSPTVSNCSFSGNFVAGSGGGIYNQSSSPTVSNCLFTANTASEGGGMNNVANSSPTVTNCTFSGNTTVFNSGGMGNNGNCNPTVTNCTFIGNTATCCGGGGMGNFNTSSPTVTNCSFIGNTAASGGGGGGMGNFNTSNPTVTNCTFSGNTTSGSGGGMINAGTSNPTVTNCGFCDNTPDQINGTFTDGGGNSLLYCPPPGPKKPDPCPTDTNDDGVTNVLDLIDVLLAFGTACP